MDKDMIKVDIIFKGPVATTSYVSCDAEAIISYNVPSFDEGVFPDRIYHDGRVFDCRSAIIVSAPNGNGTINIGSMFAPRGKVVLVCGSVGILAATRPHYSEGNVSSTGVTPQQPYEPPKTQLYGHTFDGTGDTSD